MEAARNLSMHNASKVCMTLGDKGYVYTDSKLIIYIPSYDLEPPLDISFFLLNIFYDLIIINTRNNENLFYK